jgi:hypothetical protein
VCIVRDNGLVVADEKAFEWPWPELPFGLFSPSLNEVFQNEQF